MTDDSYDLAGRHPDMIELVRELVAFADDVDVASAAWGVVSAFAVLAQNPDLVKTAAGGALPAGLDPADHPRWTMFAFEALWARLEATVGRLNREELESFLGRLQNDD